MIDSRNELEKDAKKAGVDSPEDLLTAADVKEATDLANGDQHVFMYPGEADEQPVSVIAKDRAEADTKLKALRKDKDNA